MRLSNDEVLTVRRRYLDLIGGREMTTPEKEAFIAETVESYEKHVNRGFLTYRKSVTQAGQFAALEWSGQGAILRDLLGREYIDCLGGYGIFSAGINHPKIVKAVQDQMERMALNSQELLEPWRAGAGAAAGRGHAGRPAEAASSSTTAPTPSRARSSSPGSTPSGTPSCPPSAGSTASRWARSRSWARRRSGSRSQRGLQDVRFVPYGDADALEREMRIAARRSASCRRRRGAGAGAGRGRRRRAARRTTSRGSARSAPATARCFIADEIQTGMGRTGKLWGVDHSGVVPDIMCLGKSIGGGVMPLSAFISTPEIWEVMIPNPIIHSTTFGGNPIACAAGIAAITGDARGRPARARRRAKGEYLLSELGALQQKYPQVLTDVHGKGLLIGMEFPTDPIGCQCAAGLFKRGVLVAGTYSKARTIRIEPPLGDSDGAAQGDAQPAGGYVQGDCRGEEVRSEE